MWFSTLDGVVSLNLAALQVPIKPPLLRTEAADADGRSFADEASLQARIDAG